MMKMMDDDDDDEVGWWLGGLGFEILEERLVGDEVLDRRRRRRRGACFLGDVWERNRAKHGTLVELRVEASLDSLDFGLLGGECSQRSNCDTQHESRDLSDQPVLFHSALKSFHISECVCGGLGLGLGWRGGG